MADAHPTSMTAATGTTELHAEPTALGIAAAGWVALAMLIVIGIMIWKKVPIVIARAFDARSHMIRSQPEEASRLRAEAEAELAEAKARNAASADEAAAIVAHAEAEAKQLLAKADADSADLIARRQKMAEDKI